MARNVPAGSSSAPPRSATTAPPSWPSGTRCSRSTLQFIDEAGKRGPQILWSREVFNTPYFCPSQDAKWCDVAELVPGPTVERLAAYAKKYKMAMIIPLYEREMAGVYYNTAAVVDADGTYSASTARQHIPHTNGFWEKFFFSPGTSAIPVVPDALCARSASTSATIATSRGARLLGLNGAEIVVNPSATVAGSPQYLWKLEQPARTPWPTATSSPPRTASAPRRRGTSASSTGRATLRRPARQASWRRGARTRTSLSSPVTST